MRLSALMWPQAGHSRLVLRRRYRNEASAVPFQLIIKLPSEPIPALVEDGLIQSGLGPDVSTW
ncbi:MAG: hypothetical protein J2P21_10755, partial [Chloracidobacterium sp.]|nr:hypothetical protein [Chloracidobacterium sp.]